LSKPPEIRYGEAACIVKYGPDRANWPSFNGAPCEFFDKEVKEDGNLGRVNVTYQLTDKHMIYGTWSEGYRPGGVQRRGTLPNYKADFLTNWEFGWKTSWMDNRIILNGSVFREEWKNFQFSVLGLNGLTDIRNAAQAQITGMELDLSWAATYNLLITGGAAWYDAKLSADYCGFLDLDDNPVTVCPAGTINPQTGNPVTGPQAPSGTQMPITPRFKGNLTARYTWDIGDMEAHWQGSLAHEGRRRSDLRIYERGLIGDLPAYQTFDFTIGIKKNNWALDLFVKNAFDERGQLGRFFQCREDVCGNDHPDIQVFPNPPEYDNGQVYVVPVQPRTIGLRWSQQF
jgi:outer membrane receptor protein involved in Fe transport